GYDNSASKMHATVGGGIGNHADGAAATVGGGLGNIASIDYATIGGGVYNRASGNSATVAGGWYNHASGNSSLVPGGASTLPAVVFSFAAANSAKANHQGTFVWADSTNVNFESTGSDQFLIRASGGVGITTASPTQALDVNGNLHANGSLL